MNRVLRKRLLRDFRSNFMRYFALLLLIIMGMYIVVSVVGAAETIITGSTKKAEKNCVEDGQFSVFIPLTEQQEEELTTGGITLEKMFYMDLEADDDSVLRLMKNRESINLIVLDSGRLAETNGEIVLEKRYCEEHGFALGDNIRIAGTDFVITGIGSTPDYDMPIKEFSDYAVESTLFGTAFVTAEQYETMQQTGLQKAEIYCYAYRLNGATDDEVKETVKGFAFDYNAVENPYFQEMLVDTIGKKQNLQNGIQELADGSAQLEDALLFLGESGSKLSESAAALSDGIQKLQMETDDMLDEAFAVDIDNLTAFVKAADNPRILGAAGDMQMNKEVGLLAGIIVMVLFTYVISVFVVHQIQRESSVIGALYAMGAKKKDLILHYITLPTFITGVGGLVGAAIGFSPLGIPTQMTDTYHYFSIPQLDTVYPVYLIIYSIVMPPIVSAMVNYIVIRKRLSQTALSLIRNEQKIKSNRNLNLGKMGFVRRFQVRQMIRELRTGLTVIFGMVISLMIFMMGLDCYVLCQNVQKDNNANTKFEYMYMLKYPGTEVPDGGEACYRESLSKTYLGYTLDVSVIGIDEDNPYYDAQPIKGKNSIVIGKSVQQKYGLKEGDKLILTDSANEMDYAFTIKGISEDTVGLTVFMDIDCMRELFGQVDDYYNMVLSDKALDMEDGRLYAVTTREDIARSSSVFIDLMMPLVVMLIAISVLIFCVVMYLMIGVMIDRASFGISLIQIFGFRIKEIQKLYLNGNIWIVAIGAGIGIPFSKFVMDAIYPWMIANTACGMNLAFPWYLYMLIFVGIMAVYFAVNILLVRKLKRITPAEVLKNRE